ncbi:glycosyltransferase [Cryptosporangium sp. NPDC051539]|uniref:glycosyltransferase n=1 Tax=Cryptosporangium sp. NPDC051539 TaxID=3363962 RepID=UPI0037873AC0
MEDGNRTSILFVSSGGAGMLNVMLTVAGAVAERTACEVWFATEEDHRGEVDALAGVRFASLGPSDPGLTLAGWPEREYRRAIQRSRWRAHRAVVRYELTRVLRADGADPYPAITAAIDKVQPALMVIDASNTMAVAAALTRGVPYVLSSPFIPSNQLFGRLSPRFPFLHTGLPDDMTPAQRVYNAVFRLRAQLMFLHPTMLRAIRRIGRYAREHQISAAAGQPLNKVGMAELVLSYTVFGLEYPFDLPDKVHLVGAVIPPLPQVPGEQEISGWLDRHESVVYVGFGTLWRPSEDEIHGLVDVFRRIAARHAVLWKLPASQQHLLPDDLPENLRVVSSVPSQLDVLAHPHVKLFFNHGGANGFHESVYFGKPMVLRPLWVDCYDQAIRGQTSGVGLTVERPDRVDVDDTVAKLNQVLDDQRFRERAEHLGAELRRAGGVDAAAALILGSAALT